MNAYNVEWYIWLNKKHSLFSGRANAELLIRLHSQKNAHLLPVPVESFGVQTIVDVVLESIRLAGVPTRCLKLRNLCKNDPDLLGELRPTDRPPNYMFFISMMRSWVSAHMRSFLILSACCAKCWRTKSINALPASLPPSHRKMGSCWSAPASRR